MRDPKKVLTKPGQEELMAHLWNVEQGLFFIENHMSELDLDEDEHQVYEMGGIFEKLSKQLKDGPYESED